MPRVFLRSGAEAPPWRSTMLPLRKWRLGAQRAEDSRGGKCAVGGEELRSGEVRSGEVWGGGGGKCLRECKFAPASRFDHARSDQSGPSSWYSYRFPAAVFASEAG